MLTAELSVDVVKIGTGDEDDDQACKRVEEEEEEEVPFGNR